MFKTKICKKTNATKLDANLLPFAVCRNSKVIHTRSIIEAKLNQAVVVLQA